MIEKDQIIGYLKKLREQIIAGFEKYETNAQFERTPWDYKKGKGGGEIALLRGSVFQKAAVNFSAISGDHFPMFDGQGSFFATGVSLITHMRNPNAPTVHMNLRFIQTDQKAWFGGGYDLTPMGISYEEDTAHFHAVAKKSLVSFGENLYPEFSKKAKEYFYIPHRGKERGVGGIFFDHYNTGDHTQDLKMWQSVGDHFLDAILPIYDQRVNMTYEDDDVLQQNILRAHYVEFNLIYDRGTKFGFLSGGNPEAILCSMPPEATW
ncbi:MAG: oxygen-dependent coproporphyrinogen oxidase [Waddliaceae bacterium]